MAAHLLCTVASHGDKYATPAEVWVLGVSRQIRAADNTDLYLGVNDE
jgi:hypothetical protein